MTKGKRNCISRKCNNNVVLYVGNIVLLFCPFFSPCFVIPQPIIAVIFLPFLWQRQQHHYLALLCYTHTTTTVPVLLGGGEEEERRKRLVLLLMLLCTILYLGTQTEP